MKRKLLLFLTMTALLVCLFVISVSAEALTNYASVKLTLVDNTEVTGYCKIDGRFLRDNVYKNPENTDDGVYAWGDIKVFDMRDSVIVGTKTYNEVGGTNCNGQAANVEEFYFSSQVTKILNTSFTSGWKSLKTVYIPKSVTCIANGFSNSPVCRVIFEEGSQLKTIEDGAFQNCYNLTTIDFPEGLESLGYNCFFQSGLSGTIVIPNSVTYLAPGALLSTKIENLYLGDGALEIGHNFLGTFSSTDNQYLKNVYISASTTFTATNIFYKCANPVNFYIVGSKDDCDAMVNTLKAQSTGSYMTFITAEDATEDTGAGYGIIHTEYNRCDAFYNSEHLTAEQTYDFTSFTEKSYLRSVCTRCETGAVLKEIAPLFTCLGYSTSETDGTGISIGYRVDYDAIKTYKELTGIELSYGMFATTKQAVGNGDIFDKDGNTVSGAIALDVTKSGFTFLSLKMVGFDTENSKEVEFAIGAYAVTTQDGKKSYSYIQEDTPLEGEKYCFVSYNDIVNAPSTDEEITQ